MLLKNRHCDNERNPFIKMELLHGNSSSYLVEKLLMLLKNEMNNEQCWDFLYSYLYCLYISIYSLFWKNVFIHIS